jgi:NADH:ubiquinone oxidoreductase subunit 2 (subunit N)
MLSTIILSLLGNNTQKYTIYILITVASFIYINSYQLYYISGSATLYNDTFHYDLLNQSVLIVAGLVALWLLSTYSELLIGKTVSNEWLALIVLLVVSLAGLVTSNSNLSLFVAVELQSLVLYILLSSPINANFNTFFTNSSKLGLAYLLNAAAATGFLVFGIATNSTFLVIVSLI